MNPLSLLQQIQERIGRPPNISSIKRTTGLNLLIKESFPPKYYEYTIIEGLHKVILLRKFRIAKSIANQLDSYTD